MMISEGTYSSSLYPGSKDGGDTASRNDLAWLMVKTSFSFADCVVVSNHSFYRSERDLTPGAGGFKLSNPPPLLVAPLLASLQVRTKECSTKLQLVIFSNRPNTLTVLILRFLTLWTFKLFWTSRFCLRATWSFF